MNLSAGSSSLGRTFGASFEIYTHLWPAYYSLLLLYFLLVEHLQEQLLKYLRVILSLRFKIF
jgi:hypothetical protein